MAEAREVSHSSPAVRRVVLGRLLADESLALAPARTELRERVDDLVAEVAPVMGCTERTLLIDDLVRDVGGLGPVEPLLADESVTEVMLNGPHRAFVERGGRIESVELGLDGPALRRLAERIVAPLGLRLDQAAPIVDARLPDGSRFHAVIPPLAPDGPCLTIRRFARHALGLEAFALEGECADDCRRWVREGRNILVSGGTGAGKTTFLNALSAAVSPHERIVTIEETTELQLAAAHVVRLEARPANAEGVGSVSLRDLVRTALRMRPDRLIVGEVRGAEAFDLLCALNTGHDGSLATVHANSAADAIVRLETLALMAGTGLPLEAVRAQVAAAIDVVVHLRREADGGRRVHEVAEVATDGPQSSTRVVALAGRRGRGAVRLGSPARSPRREISA